MTMPHDEPPRKPTTSTWRDFVDVDLVAKNRRDLADYLRFHNRLPDDEDQRAIKQHLQRLAQDAVVIHFDDPRQAAEVLRAGRFYSSMEQGNIFPELLENRERAERVLFGQRSPRLPDIIYATLGDTGSHGYGDVAIFLKDGVKIRATVTRKDSMNAMTASDFDPVGAVCVASGFDELDCLTVPLRMKDEITAANRIEDLSVNAYFEVQIHGGVTTEDIERLSVPPSVASDTLHEWARRRGIIVEERER